MKSMSKKSTRCMECGREIPAGMTFRKIHDKRGMPIGDHCYGKCKPHVPTHDEQVDAMHEMDAWQALEKAGE